MVERSANLLGRLDSCSRILIELLVVDSAVHDSVVGIDDLAQMVGDPVADVERNLERLVSTGTVVEQQHGRHTSYHIADPLIREMLYSDISGTRRCVMHRRIAERLLESGRRQAATSHFVRAAQTGEDLAARQLLSEAERAGDQQAIAEALGVLGPTLGWQGRFDAAEEVLLRSITLPAPAARGAWLAHNLALLATFDACRGQLGSARTRWAQAASSGPDHDPVIDGYGAFIKLLAGDLTTVTEQVKQAKSHDGTARSCLPDRLSACAAMAAAERGEVNEARRHLEAAGTDNLTLGIVQSWHWWAKGVVARAEGQLTTAVAVLQRAAEGYSAMNGWALAGFVLADLAEVTVSAGDCDAATRAASCAEDNARRTGEPIQQALHLLATACALTGNSRCDQAVSAALQAIDTFGSRGYALLAARARVVYAIAVRRSDHSAAEAALREAASSFAACGAVLRHEQANALLTQLRSGGECTLDNDSGPNPLTRRERQVAELAARGLSAPQIAKRLHIGARTVETHLCHIYPKLGVTSKQQLVLHGTELGLIPGQ
ncbi:MAG: response regulator transcription factor [Pseudonocardiaceae bacterium]